MANGVLLDNSERSAISLSDPTENGWLPRRYKSIDALASNFLADDRNTMTQADNATGCVFSWVSKLAESISGRRLLDAIYRYNADVYARFVESSDDLRAYCGSSGGDAYNGTVDVDADGVGTSGAAFYSSAV